MDIESLTSQLPEYAKDIKLNLSSVLTEAGAPGLTQSQIMGIALTCACVTRHPALMAAMLADAAAVLSEAEIRAAKAASVMMAMNNVYYRFLHLVEDPEFSSMRAGLRMNVLAQPGVPKIDFELYSLAASAINACGNCIQAHVVQILKEGLTRQAVQSAVRIASVIEATAQALALDEQ